MKDEDNKALGTGYQVEEDKSYMMLNQLFQKEKEDESGQGSSRRGVR